MNLEEVRADDLIFSLDIGTRSIIGIICKKNEDGDLEVIDYAMREHKKRNMYDGQIHDIQGVSQLVGEIKDELEKKQAIKLKTVSVAAAGRALKTKRTIVEQKIDDSRPITTFNIETLELEGVQEAQRLINEEDKELKYYSIGYSVVDYYLDEDRIDNLKGHRASRIGVEILATFLPKIVIEGLYSVISLVGLEISSITLEPIAAINICIEKDLRLLNLVLVDIGAGTSDIAITDGGQIISYDMTQTAGDEITETILKKFLLDFNESERIKRELSLKNEHIIKDILGFEKIYTTGEIVEKISGSIDKIASNIADSILDKNKKIPDAIFLIGGSSQMVGLPEKIAEKVGIAKERVSVRDLSLIKNLVGIEEINRPDMITPIGIAAEGLENKYRNFINEVLQGEDIQVFNTENIKVSDIMVLTEFDPKDLMPKWGRDFIYYRDGARRIIRGNEGTRPEILVNGKVSSLQTLLSDNDVIEVTSSNISDSKAPWIYDLISKTVPIDNILVNGQEIDEDYILEENDDISILEVTSKDKGPSKKIASKLKQDKEEVGEVEEEPDKEVEFIDLIVNGEELSIERVNDKFIFVDIFDHIDFDRTRVKGNLCLMVNGEPAEYMKELENGDELKIYWD